MLFRSREFNLAGRALFLIGSAALPAFIWATACGRPRHQSLILALMAMGLTAEYERWQIELTPKRAWNIFAGIVWGLACWTSLFEPSVVVAVLVLFNLIVRRRENSAFPGQLRDRHAGGAAGGRRPYLRSATGIPGGAGALARHDRGGAGRRLCRDYGQRMTLLISSSCRLLAWRLWRRDGQQDG